MITINYDGDDLKLRATVAALQHLFKDPNFYRALEVLERERGVNSEDHWIVERIKKSDFNFIIRICQENELTESVTVSPERANTFLINLPENYEQAEIYQHVAIIIKAILNTVFSQTRNAENDGEQEKSTLTLVENLTISMLQQDKTKSFINSLQERDFSQSLFESVAKSNFTLSVTVRDGKMPPDDIEVTLYGPDFEKVYTQPCSFSQSELLQKGAYDLNVSGTNPFEGETILEISGNFDGPPSPSFKEVRRTKIYSVDFSFIIKNDGTP